MKILVTYKIPTESFAKLGPEHTVTMPEGEYFTTEELIRLVPDYDVILGIFTRPIENSVIDAGKNLKLISNFGVGFNNIDIKYARSKGVAVCNTPKAVCFPTAEMTMGLMLSAARRITECDRRLRVEKESMWGVMNNLGFTLEGRTLGIIGMGRIGQSVARVANAFGMNVLYWSKHPHPELESEHLHGVSLEQLLAESDVISLHCPLNEETENLICKKTIAKMKQNVIIINTSRGKIINDMDLANALASGKVAYAAIDVLSEEPPVHGSPLIEQSHCLVTPHIAWAPLQARRRCMEIVEQNIRAFQEGHPQNVVC